MTRPLSFSLWLAFFVGAVLAVLASNLPHASASAPSGLQATLYSATTTVVGIQSNTQLFPASLNCAARVVSTVAQPIMILFADPTNGDLASTTLSGTKGHVQPASTTVVYDSGVYGCGRMFAFGFNASTTITVSEFK